jgi:predicted transcriptional regulator
MSLQDSKPITSECNQGREPRYSAADPANGFKMQMGSEQFARLLREVAESIAIGTFNKISSQIYPSNLSDTARSIYSIRRKRSKILEDPSFSDGPAWDILLDLFIHMADNKPVSVTSASIGANCPATTALRWLNALEDQEMIIRINDENDNRRTFIELSTRGRDIMAKALELHIFPNSL